METQRWHASENIAEAAALLRAGGLVAFPTETVYGLGADARDAAAVARIYAAKGRPQFNPLIAHVADLAAAMKEGVFSDDARKLARAFWPGPLTLVVPVTAGGTVSRLARAGLDTVALRVPSHPIAAQILRQADIPIAAPSANRSGRVSPTRAVHVVDDLGGRIDAVVDGGATPVGLESTVVACLGNTFELLRPGGIPREQIEDLLSRTLDQPAIQSGDDNLRAPGMMASHYAPRAALRLNCLQSNADAGALLDFAGQLRASGPQPYFDLSPSGDLHEAAANLFDFLHRIDATGAGTVLVAPVPEGGLGAAINDRLRRAAAPRPASFS